MNIAPSIAGLGVLIAVGTLAADQASLPAISQLVELPGSSAGLAHGAAVAVAGDLVAIGRPVDAGGPVGGAVDVYQRVAGEATLDGLPWSWEFLCRLAPESPEAGSRFGSSVDVDGTTIVVGAWSDDRGGVNAGAAWVFEIPDSPGAVITSNTMLSPLGHMEGDYFGWDVAIEGDVVVVGGWGADIDSPDDHAGAAWVFEREPDGTFLEQAKLTAGPHAEAGARFGSSVCAYGGLVAVGEPDQSAGGAVYLFHGDEWHMLQQIVNPDGHAGDEFGAAISFAESDDGDEPTGLLVGAPGDGELGDLAGAVWLFDMIGDAADVDSPQKELSPSGGPWHQAGVSVVGIARPWEGDGEDADGGGEGEAEGIPFLYGSPGWIAPGDLVGSGALMVNHGSQEDGQPLAERVDLPRIAGGGLGASLDASVSVVPNWGIDTATVVVGDPIRDGGSGGVTLLDVPIGADYDCDHNHRLDVMEMLLEPGLHDCDSDGTHDACQLNHDPWLDCDGNAILDTCDIASDPSGMDCDGDGILDACQVNPENDCNGDGVLDVCQIDAGNDCNDDGVLDSCQIDGGSDCDGDGTIDVCQIDSSNDCNGDGVLDVCQSGSMDDCDSNGLPDICEIFDTPSLDCDGNGGLDVCQIANDPEGQDCDANGELDVCQLAANPEDDCDGNGVLDACQLPDGDPGSADWMVEQFVGGIDLYGLGVRLTPLPGGPPHWGLCTVAAYDVWLDPAGHTPLTMTDDDSQLVPLPFAFDFGGLIWNEVWVGSNGYVTFGQADSSYGESQSMHFSLPRISALFDDLDPSQGGQVLHGIGPAGSFVVSWVSVPEYEIPESENTLQLVLHPDGAIEMSWPTLSAPTGIVGPSFGGGIPQPFTMTDLSNAFDCVPRPVAPQGDCDQSGELDVCEAVPVGEPLWASEHFLGDFDLSYQKVTYTPTNSTEPPFWQVCSEAVSGLPYALVEPTLLPLQDDESVQVPIGFSFDYMGQVYTDLFLSSNGHLTLGTADYSYGYGLESHFQQPRISGLMSDLNPAMGGAVSVDWPAQGLMVATWEDVPFYEPNIGDADFQIAIHESGLVEMAWLNITPPECVVGLSDGFYIPAGFAETDLSDTGETCQLTQPWNDCNGNGTHDGIEIALGCEPDYNMDGILDICEGYITGMSGACATEVTGDGVVDVRDLLAVLVAWGDVKPHSHSARCDFGPGKGDFRVDVFDLIEVIEEMRSGCDGQP